MKWPCLYISHYFKQYKAEYYARLQNIRDTGDWEAWLKFFLRGVSEVSQEATRTASAILQVRENTQKLICDELSRASAGNALTLLAELFYRPVVTVQQMSEIIGATYATANNLASDLIRIGVLRETTGWGRNRRFSYDPYLQLFSDEMPPSASARENQEAAPLSTPLGETAT
jgi:Fic family protein